MSRSSSRHDAAQIERYRDAFAARRETRAPGWLGEIQAHAFAAFQDCGFPTRKLEEWRYTNVAPIALQEWSIDAQPDASLPAQLEPPDFGGPRLVFIDGRFASGASRLADHDAIAFTTLAEAAGSERAEHAQAHALSHYGTLATVKDEGFSAFNTAFAQDAAVLCLKPGDSAPPTVQIVFVSSDASSPQASLPRLLVVAEPGSRGRIVVDHVSAGSQSHFSCAVSEVFVDQGAALEMFLVQRENDASFHIARQSVCQQRDSRFSLHTLNLGGAILRNDLEVVLADQGAECNLEGLYLGMGKQVVDNHTLVDHAMPHCQSRELYKGIVADQSRGVFRGRVVVRPDAQQTSALQQNKNIVLDGSAEIDTKPQLEIYADDVQCSHGSSIGQLDEEALFFLRSRGLDERVARTMLTTGFASQITQSIPDQAVRTWAAEAVDARLRTLIATGDAS